MGTPHLVVCLFWLCPWHAEVPRPGIKLMPQHLHQILNPLHHEETPHLVLFFFFFGFFSFSRAALVAYGGSQATGLIGAVAAGLRQSHNNLGSEPHLRPTPQLTATPDP